MIKKVTLTILIILFLLILFTPLILYSTNSNDGKVDKENDANNKYSMPIMEPIHALKVKSHINDFYAMPEPFSNVNMFGLTYSMRKSMDPTTWAQMFSMMMNSQHTSPVNACALCHHEEDHARYQNNFGEILDILRQHNQVMFNPFIWMHPPYIMLDMTTLRRQ